MPHILSERVGRHKRYGWAHALPLLCAALMLVACACASEPAVPDAAPTLDPSTSSASLQSEKATSAPIPPTQSGQATFITSTPASTIMSSAPANPYGPPTLDERIFFADVIAIVRPIAVEPNVFTVQEYGQAAYSPAVQFRYEVIEYLKGDGDSEIVVDAKNFSVTASSAEQALQTAESRAAAQLSGLDDGEAIVFLRRMEHNPDRILDASLKVSENDWRRHNAQTGLFSTGGDGDIGGASTIFSAASGSAAAVADGGESYSIDELRERVEAMESLRREGEGIRGWEECIESMFLDKNARRKYRDALSSVFDVSTSRSGLPAGLVVHEFSTTYPRQWFRGDNSHLFHYGANEVTTTRPIPIGSYEVYAHIQMSEWMPCDYVPTPNTWRYTFESSDGVLHEAFFDPVDAGDGSVGAGGGDGVLKPDTLDVEGSTDTVIERIEWVSGSVRMELDPHDPLAEHHIDFIGQDGTVSLRLDFDDGSEMGEGTSRVLSWNVCEQPWSEGDLLMLRIAAGVPDDGVQATNDDECPVSRNNRSSVPAAVLTANS